MGDLSGRYTVWLPHGVSVQCSTARFLPTTIERRSQSGTVMATVTFTGGRGTSATFLPRTLRDTDIQYTVPGEGTVSFPVSVPITAIIDEMAQHGRPILSLTRFQAAVTALSTTRTRREPLQVAPSRLRHTTLTFSNGHYVGSAMSVSAVSDKKVVPGVFIREGTGRYRWNTGDEYDGAWVDDAMEGPGTYRWADGRVYTGTFRADRMHGAGRYDYGDGSHFEGMFKDDLIHGAGVFVADTGARVEVTWEGVDPLAAVFMAMPAFADDNAPPPPPRRPHRSHEDPRTAALAVPSNLPPASLLTDPGVDRSCVVCCDADKSTAVVPCGHLVVCGECAGTGKLTRCPLCRVEVEQLLRLYL